MRSLVRLSDQPDVNIVVLFSTLSSFVSLRWLCRISLYHRSALLSLRILTLGDITTKPGTKNKEWGRTTWSPVASTIVCSNIGPHSWVMSFNRSPSPLVTLRFDHRRGLLWARCFWLSTRWVMLHIDTGQGCNTNYAAVVHALSQFGINRRGNSLYLACSGVVQNVPKYEWRCKYGVSIERTNPNTCMPFLHQLSRVGRIPKPMSNLWDASRTLLNTNCVRP